jgi:hypothetical protein
MTRITVLAAVALILSVLPARAACSGSGLTWSCTAGTTVAQINTTIGSATDGATLTFAAGSYSWTSTVEFSPLKSVTLICAAVQTCVATVGANMIAGMNGTGLAASTATHRVSSFKFQTGSCGGICFWFYPQTGQSTVTFRIRIDHNWFANVGDTGELMLLGEGSRPGKFYGSIDNNVITNTTQSRIVVYGTGDPTAWTAPALASETCLFIEDNDVNFTNPSNSGLGFLDGENAACTVTRFNTFTNARLIMHGVTHGWGTSNFEAYGNAFITDKDTADGLAACYRRYHNQGSGTGMVWDNTFSCFLSISEDAIALLHYRDTTNADHGGGGSAKCDGTVANDGNTSPTTTHRGWPCKNQPGRAYTTGSPQWGYLAPMAIFRNVNLSGGAKVDLNFNCPWAAGNYCAEHVQADRDYYNAVSATEQTSKTSPFDGTTGIGHGTLARRPDTCTHTTPADGDNGGGVMYWAKDQGSWNTTASNPKGVQRSGEDGVLYRCSATNTWTVYYTPATYPNTFAGGAAAPSDLGVSRFRLRIRGE